MPSFSTLHIIHATIKFSVSSYVDSTKSRIKPLLDAKKEMSEEDMDKFGKKDPEAYPFLLCTSIYV